MSEEVRTITVKGIELREGQGDGNPVGPVGHGGDSHRIFLACR